MNDSDPIICLCARVAEAELVALIRAGVTAVEDLRRASGANTGCGGCRSDLEELIDDCAGDPAPPSSRL